MSDVSFGTFEAYGFPCVVLRAPLGNFCGYVGVPETHPWHGKTWRQIEREALCGDSLEVHGGVTYTRPLDPLTGKNDGLWWIGFDCGHIGDYIPYLAEIADSLPVGICGEDAHKWTVDEVRAETRHLAAQLAELVA